MNPFNLVREGSEQVVALACGKCGRVYALGDRYVERCCDPRCDDCGEPCEGSWTRCNSCRAKSEAATEAARVAKAKRVPEAEYDGPVYFDGAWDEGFLHDADEFREWWETEHANGDYPAEVWACWVKRLQIPSADEIVDGATEDSIEDARDQMPDTDELQRAVDAYNASVTADEWNVDYSRRVVLAAPSDGGTDE